MDPDIDGTASEHLCTSLGREIRSVEELLYRLEIEDLVRHVGAPRLQGRATIDVERALAQARKDELMTAVEIHGLGPTDTHLGGAAAMASRLPEPWDGVMAEHCRQLETALAAIERVLARGATRTGDDSVWPRIDTWLARRTKVDDLIDLCTPPRPAGS